MLWLIKLHYYQNINANILLKVCYWKNTPREPLSHLDLFSSVLRQEKQDMILSGNLLYNLDKVLLKSIISTFLICGFSVNQYLNEQKVCG